MMMLALVWIFLSTAIMLGLMWLEVPSPFEGDSVSRRALRVFLLPGFFVLLLYFVVSGEMTGREAREVTATVLSATFWKRPDV